MFDIIDVVLLNEEYLKELVELEKICFSDPWSETMFLGDLQSDYTCYFGTFDESGVLIGYAGMWMSVDGGEITNVAVHPDHRRMGIACLLINNLMRICVVNNMKFLNLEVRESNCNAISLYSKLGFEKVGLRKNYYKNPNENAVLMTKYLFERND